MTLATAGGEDASLVFRDCFLSLGQRRRAELFVWNSAITMQCRVFDSAYYFARRDLFVLNRALLGHECEGDALWRWRGSLLDELMRRGSSVPATKE